MVGDTDATHDSIAALELHGRFARDGLEVRTLALAPGGVGGLARVLPTMAPSSRSLAAHTQLRREQRWADVVLLRGGRSAASAGVARMRAAPPTLLTVSGESAAWRSGPVPSRVLRCVGAVDRVVASEPDSVDGLRGLGSGIDEVVVIPWGVEAPAVVTESRRDVARRRLGIPSESVVVHVVADDLASEDDLNRVEAAVEAVGARWTVAPRADDGQIRFGSSAQEQADEASEASELALAAADAVSLVGSACGPPPALVRAMAAGLVPVGLDPGTRVGSAAGSLPAFEDVIGLGSAEIRSRGADAAAWVRERFTLDVVAPSWYELLEEVIA